MSDLLHATIPLLLVLILRHAGLHGPHLTAFTAGAILVYGESLSGEVPSWGCVSLVLAAAGVGLEGLAL